MFKTTESSVYDNILPIPADYVNPEVYQNSLTPISLNNNGFGLGRVISISQPSSVNFDENGLQFWKRKITIELYEVGDNSNTPDNAANTFYARLKTNLFDKIHISTDCKNIKKIISPKLRIQVWKKHFGDEYESVCPFYKCETIINSGLNGFHCGHIISEFNGGETILENLKPICSKCNSKMGTEDWKTYEKKFKNVL